MLFSMSKANSLNSDAMTKMLTESPIWNKELAVEFRALRKAWGVSKDAPVSSFWSGFVLFASAAKVSAALKAHAKQAPHVRLIIVNDSRSCLIAGKPEQCKLIISHLKCPSSPMEQGMVGHCVEVEPHMGGITEMHSFLHNPLEGSDPTRAGVELFSSAGGKVEPISQKKMPMNELVAQVYRHAADFPKVVEAVYAKGYDVFVEVGPDNLRTVATSDILGKERKHVAVSFDKKGQNTWVQLLKLAATLISHRTPGMTVEAMYHKALLANARTMGETKKENRLKRTIEVNGRWGTDKASEALAGGSGGLSTASDAKLVSRLQRIPSKKKFEGMRSVKSLVKMAHSPSESELVTSLLTIGSGGGGGAS